MTKSFSFSLGNFKCASLSDGDSRTMPLSAVFPPISEETLNEAKTQFNISKDDVEVGYNVLYIDTGQQKILIDAGLANGTLVNSLAQINVQPEEIDLILVTHGDSDHVGGLENFSNARYIIPKESWQQWTNPESLEALNDQFISLFASMRSEEELKAMAKSRENYGNTILPSLKDRADLVEAEEEIITGIRFIEAPGHRSDHFAVEITSEGQSLIHIVDSIRHPLQVSYPWASFIDSFPEQIVETNKILVKRILDKNAKVFGAHFPFPALASIIQQENSLKWKWLQ